MIQVTVLCLIAAFFTLLIKKNNPETALVLTVGTGSIVLLFLLQEFHAILLFLEELIDRAPLSGEFFLPLLKTIGIALVARTGSTLCKYEGESALASLVETAASFCSIFVALPLLKAVLQMLVELM